MQLTNFSDYALRVLMYADLAKDRLVTIDEIAGAYGISRAHLMKVVNGLTRAGYLEAVRGRSGGLRLARPAESIVLGEVLRTTEPNLNLVECFSSGNQCVITGGCRLRGVLNRALDAFVKVLDDCTLAEISLKPRAFGDFDPPGRHRPMDAKRSARIAPVRGRSKSRQSGKVSRSARLARA